MNKLCGGARIEGSKCSAGTCVRGGRGTDPWVRACRESGANLAPPGIWPLPLQQVQSDEDGHQILAEVELVGDVVPAAGAVPPGAQHCHRGPELLTRSVFIVQCAVHSVLWVASGRS